MLQDYIALHFLWIYFCQVGATPQLPDLTIYNEQMR